MNAICLIGRNTIDWKRSISCQSCEVQCSDDGRNHRIVASVNIYGLVKREGDVVAVKRAISRRIRRRQWGLRQACYKLLDIANALRGSGRVPRAEAVPEIKIEGIVKPSPLLFSEEPTELRVPEGYSLVGAKLLHCIDIVGGQIQARDILLQPRHCGVEVNLSPVACGVAAKVSRNVVEGVGAGWRQRAVEAIVLDNDFLVVGCLVIRYAEESGREVETTQTLRLLRCVCVDRLITLTRFRPSYLNSESIA